MEFPNIEAIRDGTIAGNFRDWVRLKPEARAILQKLKELEEVALECRGYMDARADLTWEDTPNEEMQLLYKLDRALGRR